MDMQGNNRKKVRKRFCMGLMAIAVLLLLSGCGKKSENANLNLAQESDLEYVKSKGTLVVGITDFAPMDYRDGEEWAGFDAELAEAFAESLGVKLKLKEIDWNKKTELLENGDIDCIWNGMTMTKEQQDTISCSVPYLSNAQVAVLREEDLEEYDAIEDCQHLLFAVEDGSSGESLIKGLRYRFTVCSTQKEALESVSAKRADVTVIDMIMAAYYTGKGREFDGLGYRISLNDEKICVGFRKDSDLTEKANEFLETAYKDGMVESLSKQYGIENAVLQDFKMDK